MLARVLAMGQAHYAGMDGYGLWARQPIVTGYGAMPLTWGMAYAHGLVSMAHSIVYTHGL